jgi:hypothetical protein
LAIALGLVVVLAAVVAVLDLLVETDREQIVHSLQGVQTAVRDRNTNQIFTHISEDFNVKGLNKADFRSKVQSHIPQVEEFKVWDLETQEVSREKGRGIATFLVRGTVPHGTVIYRCQATYVRNADGRWRLQTFQLFDATVDPARATPAAYPF